MISILVSIFAVLLSLIFGLFSFFNNIIGKAPCIACVTSIPTNQLGKISAVLTNSGLGPGLVTEVSVQYIDNNFGIDVSEITLGPRWLDNLFEKAAQAYRTANHPPIERLDYNILKIFWAPKAMVLSPNNELPLLETVSSDPKLAGEINKIAIFVSHLKVNIHYKSFFGVKYTNKNSYDPLGNVESHSWLFTSYIWLAKLFGLIK